MVKVTDKHDRLLSFDGAQRFQVAEGTLYLLRMEGPATVANTVAAFGPGEWTWATLIQPKEEEVPGVWQA
jgi:hypothetical protein